MERLSETFDTVRKQPERKNDDPLVNTRRLAQRVIFCDHQGSKVKDRLMVVPVGWQLGRASRPVKGTGK